MYSSESQGDTLMRRKLERHQQEPAPLHGPGHQPVAGRRASNFLAGSTAGDTAAAVGQFHLQQSRSFHGRPAGGTPEVFSAVGAQFAERDGDASSLSAPPVDFTQGAPAGSYFEQRQQRAQHLWLPGTAEDAPGGKEGTQRGGSRTAERLATYPEHLATQRRATLEVIRAREAEALDAQREQDEQRRQRCRSTRDAARLKRRQQEKRRVELQTMSRQHIPDAKRDEFGVPALPPSDAEDDEEEEDETVGPALGSTKLLRRTARSEGQRQRELLPSLAHLEANAARLDVAAQHREAVIARHREKAALRVATEERLGAPFAAKAAALRGEVSTSPIGHTLRLPKDGGRQAPAVDTVHQSRQQRYEHDVERHEQRCEELRLRAEMDAMDDAVLGSVGEVQAMAGSARRRIAPDVPFSTAAPFRQRDTPAAQAATTAR